MWPKLFKLFSPGIIVFNHPNDPPEGDPPAPGRVGGGDPPPAKPEPPKDQTYELTVNGEKRSVTLEEMQELATKSAGADRKFQDASQMRKEAEKGIRIGQLVKSLEENPSEDDAKELASILGVNQDEFLEYLNESDDDSTGKTEDKGKKTSVGKMSKVEFQEIFQDMFGMTPVEVKGRLDYSHERHINDARKEIRKISDEAVDKDGIFGKMIVGEKREDRLSVIKEMVAEDVLRKIQDGMPFGADMVAASVQKIRAHLTKFGIPNKLGENPIVLGLGPSGGLPTEVQADEPIKRVNAAEDGDEKNFVNRWMQKALQAVRQSRK